MRSATSILFLSLLPVLPLGCARGSGTPGDAGDDSGCPAGERLCDGECVDTLSDHSNCGECGKECAAAEVCYEGRCTTECPSGWSPCGGTCVDTRSDLENCGTCGNACNEEAACSGGECEIHLSGGLSGFKSYPASRVIIDGEARVTAYNGTDDVTECDGDETGCLRIEAKEIVLSEGATIDASGKGHGGGGGGGGGPGNAGVSDSAPCTGECVSCLLGRGGQGAAGGATGGDAQPSQGVSAGGAGGKGGGPHGGNGGGAVSSSGIDGPADGHDGLPGGYGADGRNGDESSDESLFMGSGGGGGSGGASASEHFYDSVGGSGGGGAGNPGGGYVKLIASERILAGGSITTAGLAASTGNGRNGTDGAFGDLTCDLEGSGADGGYSGSMGSSEGGHGVGGYFQPGYNDCIAQQCEDYDSRSVSGGNGGTGGTGAGGGVLLKAPVVTIDGAIDARGGNDQTLNGGTVKIFYRESSPSITGITAGKILQQTF